LNLNSEKKGTWPVISDFLKFFGVALTLMIGAKAMAFHIESPAFDEARRIPQRFAKDGENISPPLKWTDAPAGTKDFVLICDDPDAPTRSPFVHWVAYNIPADVNALPEQVPQKPDVQGPVSFVQGKNSFGDVGYDGPMPPQGDRPHHYHFHLYALDVEISLKPGVADKDKIMRSMKGHVLAEAETIGIYQR
jgi:Raf kinase inhibitor-like YbhB/YbcL family protein